MTDIENSAATPLRYGDKDPGKDSVLAEYCRTAIDRGGVHCIWICFDRHGRTVAADIGVEIENLYSGRGSFRLKSLANRYGWWKRFSAYSAKGVREVEGLDVLLLPVNHSNTIAAIDERIKAYQEDIKDGVACGTDELGQIHPRDEWCDNETWNEHDERHCPVLKIADLQVRQERLKGAEQMLNLYWTTPSNTDCLKFLREHGLVYSYRKLSKTSFCDCRHPYGQRAKALFLVEGWHVRYIMGLIGFSIVVGLCVVAIVTLVQKDVELGLAAGSYTVGVAAILLGSLTILSAIL